jgi:hypothetical protein
MPPDPRIPAQVNWAQYRPGQRGGHCESFYQRANHPSRPLAFWIRYTIFSPAGRPGAVGELWSIVFDGETGEHAVAKRTYPMSDCHFDNAAFAVRIQDSTLGPASLAGGVDAISWDLRYAATEPPLYLLPKRLYRGPLPKAKSRAHGRYRNFSWDFASECDTVRVEGRIEARPAAFVALEYGNPPGGVKHCLNTKIGSCELAVTHRSTGTREVLRAENWALFEILTDDRDHGIAIREVA